MLFLWHSWQNTSHNNSGDSSARVLKEKISRPLPLCPLHHLPPPSSSLEEDNSISAYATLSPSLSPILLVRMTNKGKQQEEETPLTSPGEVSTPFPCLICQSLEHLLGDCPEFPQIPTVIRDNQQLCILCKELGRRLKECPDYRCPICLHPVPGHGNNSCPNSPVDPDSSDKEVWNCPGKPLYGF